MRIFPPKMIVEMPSMNRLWLSERDFEGYPPAIQYDNVQRVHRYDFLHVSN